MGVVPFWQTAIIANKYPINVATKSHSSSVG